MKADYARLTMQLRMYVTHEVREIDYNYKTNKCTTFVATRRQTVSGQEFD
jgi:hypothetical protein